MLPALLLMTTDRSYTVPGYDKESKTGSAHSGHTLTRVQQGQSIAMQGAVIDE
jgi:hypothetical protein